MRGPSLALLATLPLTMACPPAEEGSEPAELETVDVGGYVDEGLDTSDDPVGWVPVEQVGGVLPVDFPPDLPVYSPSSLTDFGAGETERYVTLTTSDPPETVRERLAMQLRKAGWSSSGERSARWRVSRDGRSATIRVEGDVSGSEIRIDYR